MLLAAGFMRLLFGLMLVSLLAASCGESGHGEHGHKLTVHLQELDVELGKLASLAQAHRTAIEALTQQDGVTGLETEYRSGAGVPVEAMGATCASMKTDCKDSGGKAPETAALTGVTEQMKQELDNHRAAMTAAGNLEVALAEESRHQTALTNLQAQLKSQRDALNPKGESFSCEHGGGH